MIVSKVSVTGFAGNFYHYWGTTPDINWEGLANRLPLLLLLFSAGVLSLQLVPNLPDLYWFGFMAAAATVLSSRFRILWPLFLAAGIFWSALQITTMQSAMIPVSLEKIDLVAEGRISGQVTQLPRGSRFEFEVDRLFHKGRLLPTPGKIRLTSYSRKEQFSVAERWKFRVRLKRPRSLVNPGMSFDYAAWLIANGISATGYIVNGTEQPLGSRWCCNSFFYQAVGELRQGFSSFLSENTASKEQRSVFAALSVGIRSDMSSYTWDVLQRTGTAHLIAISGLHVGFVALIAAFAGGLIWCIIPGCSRLMLRSTAGWICAITAAFIYGALADFPLPTRRALLMLAIASVIGITFRRASTFRLLSIVLAIMLICDALAPLASSFWLSFMAVGVIACILGRTKHHTPHESGIVQRLGVYLVRTVSGWSKIQLGLFVGMAPVLLVGFQQLSLVAPIANLLVVPLVGFFLVPLVLAAMIMWAMGWVYWAKIALVFAGTLFDVIWQILDYMSGFSGAILQLPAPSLPVLLVSFAGVAFALLARGLPGRWVGLLWLLPLMISPVERPGYAEFRLVLLDVGQGLSAVVETTNRTMVFDTGAAYASGFNLAEAVVLPYLRSRRIGQIDKLVISHSDNDHAGGAQRIVKKIPVVEVMASSPDDSGIPSGTRRCRADDRWFWDGVLFEVLWPESGETEGSNNASCVLRISSLFGSALLTGDIEKKAEKRLVARYGNLLVSDVLQVPHHGSFTSSTPGFIDAVNPVVAIVGAGYLNRFGHPSDKVSARYVEREIPLLTTAQYGATGFVFQRNDVQIFSQRTLSSKIWRAKPAPLPARILASTFTSRRSDILPSG